ncbi:MAG: SRPBCC family protein [Ornithinimicrobium sp.]
MSEAARVSTAAPRAQAWRVLADVEQWPSWSSSVVAVTREDVDEHTAYRIEQPPLPHALWTLTQWQPDRGFTWQTRGASSVLTASYVVAEDPTDGAAPGTVISVDLQWSGPMAWMARATYGPVSLRFAQMHLDALRERCEVNRP